MQRKWLIFSKIIFKILLVLLAVICLFVAIASVFICLLKKQYPITYKEQVFKYSREFSLESTIVFATIKVESNFNPKAVSNKGAVGLMQIMPSTAKFIAQKLGEEEYDLFNEETNIRFGCYYLSYLITKFKNIETAIVAYNAGEGNVRYWLTCPDYSKDGKNLYKVPFLESANYLTKMQKSLAKYTKLYGKILDNK